MVAVVRGCGLLNLNIIPIQPPFVDCKSVWDIYLYIMLKDIIMIFCFYRNWDFFWYFPDYVVSITLISENYDCVHIFKSSYDVIQNTIHLEFEIILMIKVYLYVQTFFIYIFFLYLFNYISTAVNINYVLIKYYIYVGISFPKILCLKCKSF